jgi:DNA-binding LacI/PurR family transcriptional regulator
MTIMKDVADAAGVSLITVSRVINAPELVKEETRLKIEKAMRELGFLPNHAAKALAENNTRAIHLYVPRYMSISEPFMMQLIAGVSEVLSEAYYLFLIRRDLEFNQRCDGVIVMGIQMWEEDVIKDKFNVPVVLFGKTKLDLDCVDIDNFQGAIMMTEHMIEMGHKKIGFVMLKTDQRFAFERFEGYKYALKKHNLNYDEKLVRYAEDLGNSGYEKSLELISQEKPTSVFCCNDLLAIGACRAIEKLKLKIPKDISLGGFDGLTFDLIPEKPISTVKQPVYEAGRRLAARMLDRLKNPELAYEKSLIAPELIIRKTIAQN